MENFHIFTSPHCRQFKLTAILAAPCCLLLLAFAALCATPVHGQDKKKVAVYVTGDADANTKKYIGAKLVAAITKDDEYAAVERTADFLAELSKEQGYQRSGAVDDSQITQLGKQFGVAFVCVADLGNLYGSLFVTARLINVQTGLVTATAEREKEVSGMADLTDLADGVALGLIPACNQKDRPVSSKGCCAGLRPYDGICRDMSGDMYWITNCSRAFLARLMPAVDFLSHAGCPSGYSIADDAAYHCLWGAPGGAKFLGGISCWTQADMEQVNTGSIQLRRRDVCIDGLCTFESSTRHTGYAGEGWSDWSAPRVQTASYLCVRN